MFRCSELFHLEEAVSAGHPYARYRYHLVCSEEEENERIERALKNWIIAANRAEGVFPDGKLSKANFAALQARHQAAVDETKSPQREAAANCVLPNQ